jgi:hypothetical protein
MQTRSERTAGGRRRRTWSGRAGRGGCGKCGSLEGALGDAGVGGVVVIAVAVGASRSVGLVIDAVVGAVEALWRADADWRGFVVRELVVRVVAGIPMPIALILRCR